MEILVNESGYKLTYAGKIPNDWDTIKLGEVGKIVSGLTYSPTQINNNGKLVLRSSNVQGRKITFDDNVYVEVNESGYNPVQEGDVLICVRNGSKSLIGKNAIVTKDCEGVAFGAFMSVYRSKMNEFLYHLFDTDLYNRQIHRNLGATINSINGSDLKKFVFPLPPEEERKKIAKILFTWDEAIDKTQQLIEHLKLRKKGLLQKLISGKKRLPGFDGEWKELKADKIFSNHSDKSHNGELEVLSATQDKGVIPRSEVGIDIKYDRNSLTNYKKVDAGDFVISLRSFQGGIEHSSYNGLVSPAYTVLKEKLTISKKFYTEYLKSGNFIQRLNSIIYGIRDGKQISYKEFSTLKLWYPPIEEQHAISKFMDITDKDIKAHISYLEQLKSQKKGLMQQLLTGEKRVKI